ncbi:cytochrome P450 2U1-like, partial [Stegodyphus dumicola]|uniref:cytochrome P450 2U1-like n=1 Tax=Stegodyphus dumicola TaxID=202533 RepID=UPI0015A9E249
KEVLTFSQTLQKTQGAPVEISHALSSSISSNIISLLIGRRLRKDVEADKVQLSVEFSDVSFTYMGPSNAVSLVPGLRKVFEFFKIAGYDRAAHIIKSFCSFVKEEISRHKTSPEFQDVHDFINSYLEKQSKMMASEKIKHYFSERNLEGNLNILFLAASDTIFSSLGWLLRLMTKHRDIQQKVYTELMEVLGKDGIARYEERHKIPYTFAVVMEAQRYSSIVPLSTTRSANQDFQIRGLIIPKGAEIVANLWALHNDPNYWEEPEKFKPERFLADDNTTLIKQPKSYAPFSIGRRNCPGDDSLDGNSGLFLGIN